jgi:hypothetical protein
MRLDPSARFTTTDYIEQYSQFNREFHPTQQEDAIEYFQSVFDAAPSHLARLYEGKQLNVYQTLGDEIMQEVPETFNSIALDVAACDSLMESIQRHCSPIFLTGDNQYHDSLTGQRLDAKRTVQFTEAPQFLVLHLKRFEFELRTFQRYKIDKHFDLKLELNFAGVQFHLTGMVLHRGSVDYGHYVSTIRDGDKWILMDDSSVAELSDSEAYARAVGGTVGDWSAYILFFSRSIATPQDPELPPDLREEIDRHTQICDIAIGLAQNSTMHFVAQLQSPHLKFLYFLRVLCCLPTLELAQQFVDAVRGLSIYSNHVDDIINVLRDNGNAGSILLEVVASSGSTDFVRAVLDREAAIGQPRVLFEWFGSLFR